MSKLAGKKYRPSNGTEGEIFSNNFCDCCSKKFGPVNCSIPSLTMAFSIDESEYPKEWLYSVYGNPTCTSFNRKEKK